MKEKKVVIGLIGEKGSGKETVGNIITNYFSSYDVSRVRSSDVLGNTLAEWGISQNRRNLQQLAIVMDDGFGAGTLSAAVRKRIMSLDADIIIFDGIRWKTDVELLKSFEKNMLFYVTADEETRYQRIKSRKEKVGEDLVSFEQFMKEEQIETELQISLLGKEADVTILNNQSLESLKTKLEKCLIDLKKEQSL